MVLDNVQSETRDRVAQDQKRWPLEQIRSKSPVEIPDPFESAFSTGEINVIAEIKYGSPSRGAICDANQITPTEVARQYIQNGAMALSILTEPKHFDGSYDYLTAVREKNPTIPILMKDFFFEPYQFYLARYLGASISLLMVRYLDEIQLKDFYDLTIDLGMSALVEVHDLQEVETAAKIGCSVMGVNNRNLETLEIDLNIAKNLSGQFPDGAISICESGISKRSELDEFRDLGFDGFLIGSSLMADGQPGKALNALIGG
ncbi:MAG: indole-3-glycerol phosphate synthase TrpC [Bacteroidetes bacterium]|nr:indole-3-glycerol phosphate synthase TrpC [Bacteroidota bacterium]